MSTATEYANQSATVSEASASQTDPASQFISVSATASNGFRGLLDVEHGVPIGESATVVSATLYLYKAASWSGAGTLTVAPLDALWDAATATWTNQPGVRAGTASTAVSSGGAAGDEISINVTSLVSASVAVEDAAATRWYGLRLYIPETGERTLYSAFAADQSYRPRLDIEWNVPPDEPTDLLPSDGLAVSSTTPEFFWTFTDDDSEDTISAVHFQLKSGSDDFTTPTYDSGWLSHTEPSFDFANPPTGAPAVPTITAGTNWYWRVAVRDNHSGESDWSDVALFVRVAKGALTLTTPTVLDSPVPVITHALTVETQSEVEVLVERREDGVWQEHYWLPRNETAATSHQVPDANRLEEGYTYRISVKVWTTTDRDDLPGDRDFLEATFTGAF